MSDILFALGVVAALISTLSFLAKSEAIRGGGRIVGGAAWILVALSLWSVGNNAISSTLLHCGVGTLALCGAATGLFGLRKFLRRNQTS